MRKMFTLRGISEVGKTTKIKKIAEWIIDNYSPINTGIVLPLNWENQIPQQDITGILDVNGFKIAFVSGGDNLDQVIAIDSLLKNNTTIIKKELLQRFPNIKLDESLSQDDLIDIDKLITENKNINIYELFSHFTSIDIIFNTCRTKGEGFRHINNNYNFNTGWLGKYIWVNELDISDIMGQKNRDNMILLELQTWLFGIKKG